MDRLSAQSYWHETADAPPEYPRLERDVEADVAVIGAGITGLTAALHLKAEGLRVCVLEAGRVGAGTTGGTSGHLDAMPDQGATRLIRDHGEVNARLVTEARMAAIDQIEAWCTKWQIDCDFARVPAYVYSETADGAQSLMEEHAAARKLGLHAEAVREVPLPFKSEGGFRIERQAHFHSMRYLNVLAERFHGDGCALYTHTRARPPEDGEPCTVETDRGNVKCRDVLICTHSAYLGVSQFDMRMAPYQSYVLSVTVATAFPDALFWDDASPYNYLRRARGDDAHTVIIGGADHKTGQGGDEAKFPRSLEQYVRARFDVQDIRQRWSAELFEPADGLPFVGRVPLSEHRYMASGFSGTGLTFGTAAGRILADCVLGCESPLAKVLSPSRFKLVAAAGNLLSENLNVAKRFVMDRLGPDAISSLDEIPLGSGRLVRYQGQNLAAYRTEEGNVHLLSPVCTHAGCYVQWNEAEKTWDCPCHGGRYSAVGERLYGPPPEDLERKPKQEP